MSNTSLSRSLSLPLLTFYGLGTILGAGIYALVGKVAGEAGMLSPVAFLMAALLAAFTGLSYAELSARFPRNGGEAVYVKEAFGFRMLSLGVGLLVTLSATISAATLSTAFSGYARELLDVPDWLPILIIVLAMGSLAAWGIRQSAWMATVMTVIELCGLLLILWVGREALLDAPGRVTDLLPSFDASVWIGILSGAFLAFYAFIGFEDMVNVAEEVKEPQRNLPIAIIIALLVTTVLYSLIALVSVLSIPVEELARSDAPLSLVYERTTDSSPVIITVIGLFAVTNGILIQIIMASRILYGFGASGQLPAILGRVHPYTHTPLLATALVAGILLLLALLLPLEHLAEITSFLILIVFLLVNASLIRLKYGNPHPEKVRTFPILIPIVGCLTITGLLLFKISTFFLPNA